MSSVEWLKPWPPGADSILGRGRGSALAATQAVFGVGGFSRPPLPPTHEPSPPRQKKATAEAMASGALVPFWGEWRNSKLALVKDGLFGVGGFSRPLLPPTHKPVPQR